MGRYYGSVCKICRRYKEKLFLKSEKCFSKCVIDKGKRKGRAIGKTGTAPKKISEYARHLLEKQKLKFMMRLTEEQLRSYFKIASRKKGLTGENLLILLERRLDNVLVRSGLASSIKFAAQMINHGHITLNGVVKRAPGYLLKVGDVISVKRDFTDNVFFKKSFERSVPVPSWLEVDRTNYSVKIVALPERKDISLPIDETLIVEFYSR